MTISVVAAIEPKIRMAEIERAMRKPTESLQAYDLVLRGRWVYQSSRRDRYEEAARLYRRAIRLDPNYAVAYALLARALWLPIAFLWTEPSESDLIQCVDFARTAIRLGQAEPETLGLAAHIIGLPGGELAEGIAIIDRALVQNPNSVDVLAASGMLRAFVGDTMTAFRHLHEAERLSPAGVRVVNKSFGLCLASFVDGDYASAADWAAQDLRERSINVEALRYRAAALGLLGRLDEAGQTVDRLLDANPEITISRCRRHIEFTMKNPFKRAGVVEAYYEGLAPGWSSRMSASEPDRRKLVAVVYADMVGYSRLIGLDDIGTLERLRALRRDVIDPAIEEHGGRIVKTGGDSLLIVFDSVDGAVRCAVKVQQQVPDP